jgi:hypothetical protein
MPCLQPLPATSYDYGSWRPGLRIQRHYHVNVEGRDYSVPSHLIGELVSLKVMAATIEIYHDRRSWPCIPVALSRQPMTRR